MPVNTNAKTRWEEQATATYLLDPDTGNPAGSLSLPLESRLTRWHYVGGQTIIANGEIQAAIPATATIVEIRARGGAVWFAVNGVNCNANSPGYVPEAGAEIIGPLDNLDRLWVYGTAATTYAHIMYFRETVVTP